MREPGFIALGVERACAHACPCWHAYHHIGILAPAVMYLGQVIDDLIKAHRYEIGELHFHHAFKTLYAQAQCGAHDSTFAQRRVAHALAAILLHHAFCNLERAAIFGYILTHKHQVRIAVHALAYTVAQRLYEFLFGGCATSGQCGAAGVRCIYIGKLFGRIGGYRRGGKTCGQAILYFFLYTLANTGDLFIGKHLFILQELLIIGNRVFAAPLFKQLLRHIFHAAGLLMSAHAEGHTLHQYRLLLANAVFAGLGYRLVNFQYIVTIYGYALHTVANGLVGQLFTDELLIAWCAQAIAIVLNDEDDRQAPDSSHIERLVKVALAGAAIAAECQRYLILFAQFMCQCNTIANGQLRPKVTDHATDVVFIGTEMKRAFAALAEAFLASLPLHEQLVERHFTRCEHTQITVHRHYVLISVQRHSGANSNSFLAYTAEPLADLPLAQQHQHLFLDHARAHELGIYIDKLTFGEPVLIELHSRDLAQK